MDSRLHDTGGGAAGSCAVRTASLVASKKGQQGGTKADRTGAGAIAFAEERKGIARGSPEDYNFLVSNGFPSNSRIVAVN